MPKNPSEIGFRVYSTCSKNGHFMFYTDVCFIPYGEFVQYARMKMKLGTLKLHSKHFNQHAFPEPPTLDNVVLVRFVK